jgi:hypothetical protein
MMDSKEKTLTLIKRVTENLAGTDGTGNDIVDASLTLDDLHVIVARLEHRIKKGLMVLTGKDSGTAQSIKKAVQDDYLAKHLKARAVLMRVHQRVKHSLLSAVPYKRRISHAKKGVFELLTGTKLTSLLEIDVKIRKKTEDSIARRIPGICELAKRYNTLCAELSNHPSQRNYPSATSPRALDVDQLFNLEANQHMWMEQGLDIGSAQPAAYLYDDRVREGVSALLVLDRAEEEEHWLTVEATTMAQWLGLQLKKVHQGLELCTGQCFFFDL